MCQVRKGQDQSYVYIYVRMYKMKGLSTQRKPICLYTYLFLIKVEESELIPYELSQASPCPL